MSMSLNRPLLGSLALALALATGTSLAQSQTTTTTTVSMPAGSAMPGDMPMATSTSKMDRMFMMMAAQGGMTEIKSSELTTSKSTNDDVKAYGQQMITDHTDASDKLMTVAMAHGVMLPKTLDAKHKAGVSMLMAKKNGTTFDKAYVAMMVKDHDKTVALFEKAANDPTTSPDVRQFASDTLPTLKEHQAKIKEMQSMMMKA